MASARTRHAQQLFAGLPRRYDLMAEVLSLGQNARWRRFLVSRIPVDLDAVLDAATGTGAVAIDLVERCEARAVVGLDQSRPMLLGARARLDGSGRHLPIRLVGGDAQRLPFPDGAFDALTFTYLLRYSDDPWATMRELVRVVRRGGTVASLEFGVPSSQPWRALWWLHTRAVLPAIGGLVSTSWWQVGRFLGPSISRYVDQYPTETQIRMWEEAGLTDVRARSMSLGGAVVLWGRKRT